MRTLLTLDMKGIFLAVIFGIVILYAGGGYGTFLLGVILLFLGLSAIVTRMGRGVKRHIDSYSKVRGWRNVLANGLMPVVASVLILFVHSEASIGFLVIGYVASVAAVTADKFGSEVGILDPKVWELFTFKKSRRGRSGAVSLLGLVAGFGAAIIISLPLLILGFGYWIVAAAAFAGFCGSLVDSLFGYFEEKGIGNKYTSNLLCSVAGFAIVLLLVLIFNL